jgi:hypothetical protein
MFEDSVVITIGGRAVKQGRLLPQLATALAICTTALASGLACAQEPTEGAVSDQLEQVVITAEKREENLEKAPLAVTAISSDTLRARRDHGDGSHADRAQPHSESVRQRRQRWDTWYRLPQYDGVRRPVGPPIAWTASILRASGLRCRAYTTWIGSKCCVDHKVPWTAETLRRAVSTSSRTSPT